MKAFFPFHLHSNYFSLLFTFFFIFLFFRFFLHFQMFSFRFFLVIYLIPRYNVFNFPFFLFLFLHHILLFSLLLLIFLSGFQMEENRFFPFFIWKFVIKGNNEDIVRQRNTNLDKIFVDFLHSNSFSISFSINDALFFKLNLS